MTICSHDALFSQNDEEMDDLNAQRRASGKLPYSTGTEFVVNKFRMHFFHGSDLHDGTGVEDNFVLLLSLHNLELEPIVNDPPIPEDEYLHTVDDVIAARWARMVLKRRSSERGEREKRFYGDGKGERRRTAF